jgi:CO/xanthine dehydrogenase Mo-binding subunit
MAFLKKSGRLGGSKSKVSSPTTDSDLAADWMAQGSSSSSSSSSSSQTAQDAAATRKRREEAEAEAEADRRRLLNVNRYAAGGGGGGAAAFTKIRKQEQSRVEKMQNQTFTRWVNLQLQHSGSSASRPMLDLVQGLASGENLLRLLAVLSGKNPSATAQTSTSSLSSSVSRYFFISYFYSFIFTL